MDFWDLERKELEQLGKRWAGHHWLAPQGLWDAIAWAADGWHVLGYCLDEMSVHGAESALIDALAFARDHGPRIGGWTPGTAETILPLWQQFEQFATKGKVRLVGEVDEGIARAWIHALTTEQAPPSVATMHNRRTAVRLLFSVLRTFGAPVGDPSLDVDLPAKSGRKARALSDDEIVLCRSASIVTREETRLSALWALAEAGVTTGEGPKERVRDVDVDGRRLWIPGSSKTDARCVPLSDWSALQLARRIRALGRRSEECPLVYDGESGGRAGTAAFGGSLRWVLRRAGLGREPDVRALSVRVWLGERVLRKSGRIDEAACRLGLRSLDGTARLIGFKWREAHG